MKKLKNLIEQYSKWSVLEIYSNRIETYSKDDFSQALENAKALLETISKEICKSKNVSITSRDNFNQILRKAFISIGYQSEDLVTQISSSLAKIGQKMGELRNEIGSTSHGKPLEELRDRNNRVDELTKEFLIDTTVIISCFLIRTYENENLKPENNIIDHKLLYNDNEYFNDYWDNIYGEFEMGDYSYLASEILFYLDHKAYETEYKTFIKNAGGNMIEIYKNLFIGNESSYELMVKNQPDWYIVHACKEPYHRALLGYKTRGAPNDHPEYLFAIRNNRLFLNLVDADNPAYIPEIIINEALKFIDKALKSGLKCLVHCNLGESRSPSIGLLYLAVKSLIPISSFQEAEQSFKKIYSEYYPKNGIREFMQINWDKYAGKWIKI